MVVYHRRFYRNIEDGSTRSAREVVPIVMTLVDPKSVLDVGCGVGTWLSEFRSRGVEDVLGVDGDYVDRTLLRIPVDRFQGVDVSERFYLNRKFDLVISLEVAEHIPARRAESFVESLVAHGQVILFSAAIPYQGGTHHVNEQWPEYWIDLFNKKGYVAVDAIRRRIWKNERVEFWYRQNILIFFANTLLERNCKLREEISFKNGYPLSIVHPEQYIYNCKPGWKNFIKMLTSMFR